MPDGRAELILNLGDTFEQLDGEKAIDQSARHRGHNPRRLADPAHGEGRADRYPASARRRRRIASDPWSRARGPRARSCPAAPPFDHSLLEQLGDTTEEGVA